MGILNYLRRENVYAATALQCSRWISGTLKEMAAQRLIARENVVLEQGNLD